MDTTAYTQETLIKDVEWAETDVGTEDKLFVLHLTGNTKLTVLDRMTGYGGGIRDIESGFTDSVGKFWLASGGYDVRSHTGTVEEAIVWVKEKANTCVGI